MRPVEKPSREEINLKQISTDHLVAEIGTRTANGGAIAIASQVIQVAISIISIAALSRLLEPIDFGLVAMAYTVITFANMFTDFGLTAATVQREELRTETVSALFYVNLAMGGLIMLLTIAAAPVAGAFFGDDRVTLIIVGLAAAIPLNAAAAQHMALLMRGMRWVPLQVTRALSQAIGATVAVLLAWKTDYGYWCLVIQSWITASVILVLAWYSCPWRPGPVTAYDEVKSAIRFGFNLSTFTFINYFHRQFDDVLIGWRCGATELGFYSRAYKVFMIPLSLINGPISSAVLPALSRLQNQPDRWEKFYLDALAATTMLSALLTALMIATAHPLIELLLGGEWGQAAVLLQILSASAFFGTPANTCGWILISRGQVNRMARWAAMATPFFVCAFAVGVAYGATGVAAAYAISMSMIAPSYFAFSIRDTQLSMAKIARAVLPPTIIGVGATLSGMVFITFMHDFSAIWQVVVTGTVVGMVYLVLSVLVGAVFTGLPMGYNRLVQLLRSDG